MGLGYIDPSLKDAGATKVECPDAQTMILTTDDPSTRILQTYIPILPRHIWGKDTYKTLGEAKFDPPADGSGLVGSGPYLAAEWKTGEFVRFVRNPNYWGPKGAADEVVLQFFKNGDTMVQALKAGELDYARGVNADQFNQLKSEAGITTVVGTANGWTEVGFNTYVTGTGKTTRAGARPRRRSSTRPSGMPSATRSTSRPCSTGSSAATARSARRTCRRCSASGTSRPRPSARSTSRPPGRSSTQPATSSMARAIGSTRRASRSTSCWSCRTPTTPIPRSPSSSRTGGARSGSR